MITITFLLIAYLMRNKFLPEGISVNGKVWYYAFCVVFTPVIGPFFFNAMLDCMSRDHSKDDEDETVFPVDDLF